MSSSHFLKIQELSQMTLIHILAGCGGSYFGYNSPILIVFQKHQSTIFPPLAGAIFLQTLVTVSFSPNEKKGGTQPFDP